MNIDIMLALANAQREQRDKDLSEALGSTSALREMVARDCAELLSAIGDYAAPLGQDERKVWIRRMMSCDPAFRAKVMATSNLLLEYVDAAMKGKDKELGKEKEINAK